MFRVTNLGVRSQLAVVILSSMISFSTLEFPVSDAFVLGDSALLRVKNLLVLVIF